MCRRYAAGLLHARQPYPFNLSNPFTPSSLSIPIPPSIGSLPKVSGPIAREFMCVIQPEPDDQRANIPFQGAEWLTPICASGLACIRAWLLLGQSMSACSLKRQLLQTAAIAANSRLAANELLKQQSPRRRLWCTALPSWCPLGENISVQVEQNW